MRDVLVRSHDNHATPVSIDAPHVENVMAALQVRAEHLFVVTKPVMALPGQKERGHGLDGKLKMALLEDGPDIDHGVDIRPPRRVSPDRRSGRLGEKLAQGPQPGGSADGVLWHKGEETPAAVRFDCMTQVNRLGIRHHRLWPLAARRAGVQRPRHFPPGAGELGGLINK